MKSTFSILLAIFTFTPLILNAQSFQTKTNSGFLMAMITGIIALVVILIGKGFKKIDNKVDDLKLERDPANKKVIEKKLVQALKAKNNRDILQYAALLHEVAPDHLMANTLIGIKNYENQDFTAALKHLEKAYNVQMETNQLGNLSLRYINSDIVSSFGSDMGLGFYYYGHILHMNGHHDQAQKVKKQARKNSFSVRNLKLY